MSKFSLALAGLKKSTMGLMQVAGWTALIYQLDCIKQVSTIQFSDIDTTSPK